MAKKQHRHAPPVSTATLRARADRAASEGRFQQALELAKSLYKDEPTPAHKEYLLQTYLGRARQLRRDGHTRDAQTVLQVAQSLASGDAVWRQRIAEELLLAGDVPTGLQAFNGQTDSPAYARALALAADTALQREAAGRSLLPETLHADFDRILKAFADLEAGRDDKVREALQAIGLRSPFNEWKLLLRGLLAYYANDSARANENWQRLAPDRLPARLAAPLRLGIDPAYRDAQPPEARAAVQRQADRLENAGVLAGLRQIQRYLATQDQSLAQAFRQVDVVLPALRQEEPQLVSRLARCLYWAIVSAGRPEDIHRYQRVFGAPPDDPQFSRLRAIGYESGQDWEAAHRYWQEYERALAGPLPGWTAEEAAHGRAMVWLRMGENAQEAALLDNPNMPPFLRNLRPPTPLAPPADQCFRRAVELAPSLLAAHRALFEHFREKKKLKDAIKVGQKLLEQFPEDLPTLEALGELALEQHRHDDAVKFFERASRVNPLERRLRGKLSTAHIYRARAAAEAGQFDKAREGFRTALATLEGSDEYTVLCKWAACEFKAGDDARAEELLAEALARNGLRLAVVYSMLIEVIRMKLPRKLKTRFDREFKAALAEPPTAAAAVAVAATTASHHLANVNYFGQKTHQKKIVDYLRGAREVEYSETQLEGISAALQGLGNVRLLMDFLHLGMTRFPRSPTFPLLMAMHYLRPGRSAPAPYQVRGWLQRARELASALPPDARQKQTLETIRHAEEKLAAASPFGRLFDLDMLGEMFGGELDGEDDEDDEYFDEWGNP